MISSEDFAANQKKPIVVKVLFSPRARAKKWQSQKNLIVNYCTFDRPKIQKSVISECSETTIESGKFDKVSEKKRIVDRLKKMGMMDTGDMTGKKAQTKNEEIDNRPTLTKIFDCPSFKNQYPFLNNQI